MRPTFWQRRARRKGAVLVLSVFFLVAIMALAGALVSLAYIEMSRTELQAATDAAARSAVVSLVTTQSTTTAQQAASNVASRYSVGGRAFVLPAQDVAFGNSARQNDGSFRFTSGGNPTNSARIMGKKLSGSAAGAVNLPLGSLAGRSTFETQLASTAMRLDYDICLVVDRSGSMGWDLGSQRFVYPGDKAKRPLLENYFSPPDSTGSRWAALVSSLQTFVNVLASRDVSARVSLVTFAGDYTFGDYQSLRVTRDCDLTTNYNAITAAALNVGTRPVIGGTDISAGLTEARNLLTSSSQARPRTAQPTIVLFSDGIFTEGGDPRSLVNAMYADYGIVLHSVTFGAEPAACDLMDELAYDAGKGLSLHANTAAELRASFETIAAALPVILTE